MSSAAMNVVPLCARAIDNLVWPGWIEPARAAFSGGRERLAIGTGITLPLRAAGCVHSPGRDGCERLIETGAKIADLSIIKGVGGDDRLAPAVVENTG